MRIVSALDEAEVIHVLGNAGVAEGLPDHRLVAETALHPGDDGRTRRAGEATYVEVDPVVREVILDFDIPRRDRRNNSLGRLERFRTRDDDSGRLQWR